MFDADRPIQSQTEDRLGRATFAKYLARCMLDHRDTASMVVSLHGGFGSGKTSVVNLVIEELNAAAVNMELYEKPIVLNFSPWSYSGQNQLIYSFFRRVSSTLRSTPYLEDAQKITHLLELYVSFFTHEPVPKTLRAKRSIKERLTLKKKEDISGWQSGRDLTQVKAELNKRLSALRHKIIIVIDNISRLYDAEIKQIFQMVKSIGDFSNTIYLLSYDKEQIVFSLNRIDGQGGQALLDKVIQLPFEIPSILQQNIEAILEDKLLTVVRSVPRDAWDPHVWTDIYYSSFRYFFQNVRDITRYINTLMFSYPRLQDVVHPADFFALTAIEVFLPTIYASIRDNKDLFTDLLSDVYLLNDEAIAKDRVRLEEIITRNHRIPDAAFRELLQILFPRLRKIFQPDIMHVHYEQAARKEKRLCTPDLFDAYFRLSIQLGQFPESEFRTVLQLAADEEGFSQALARLNKDERILPFLCQLDSYHLDVMNKENIYPVIGALLDSADLFPRGTVSALSIDTFSRVTRIIMRLLKRVSQERRYEILHKAILASKNSIMIIISLYESLTLANIQDEVVLENQYCLVLQEDLGRLKQDILKLIKFWAESGRIASHPDRLKVLFAWQKYGGLGEVSSFVKQWVQTDMGLVSFLVAVLEDAIKEVRGKNRKETDWTPLLQHIDTMVNIPELTEHAAAVFQDGYFEKLREEEQLAIIIFLDTVKADARKVIPQTTV